MTPLMQAWMRHLETVRWFGGKGAGAHITALTPLGWYTPTDAVPAVRSEIAALSFPDGHQEFYHLLVAYYPADAKPQGTVLGTLGGDQVVDATTDPDALSAFVVTTAPQFAHLPVGVWRGEQSNTTLTLGTTHLYKLFRRVEPGPNLDAEVLIALRGFRAPAVLSRLKVVWPAGETTDAGMIIERVADATDGWELACAACAAQEDFSDRARALGEALAQVHTRLAEAFGTRTIAGDAVAEEMRRRLATSLDAAGQLLPYADALAAAFDALRGQTITAQRIHGDFHLGQTLSSPAGWTLIDFEGEPAKTAAERRAFDSPWRDVAGMIRSFDYARSAHSDPTSQAAISWADTARDAFLAGYCGDAQPRSDLLAGYVVDKAIYEVVYEVRNRPDWVDIPLRAIEAVGGVVTPARPQWNGVTMSHDSHGGLQGWDLEGFHNGGDTEVWKRLGAHVVTVHDEERGELTGTRFAVWAPNATDVRINADFNWWTGDPLTRVPGTGVWATFVEGVGDGTLYKFNILGADGVWHEKVDPMAFFAEQAPANSSIVYTSAFGWDDDEWMAKRASKNMQVEPMSIYEVHLGSWRKGKTYLELAEELVEYVTWQGFTHVEFLPVSEHPFEPSWGYQVTNYFAPESRLGKPDEFRYLVDRLHRAGVGVILDWVPGHFPKDEWALGRFDGTALYEHADPRQGEHKDWGTYIFNYGRNEVKSFLVSNALYWATEFHIDGLRVDAVASMLYLDYSRNEGEWVPNEFGGNHNLEAIDFLRYVNRHLYERVPGITMIAEESTSFSGVTQPTNLGGLGFGMKWNMGWMNDSLRYLALEPIYRQWHHHEMTFAMVYQYSENFILPISHDEVVHGKGSMINKIPQDAWRQFATLRAFYAFMWAFPGKQLLFMGQEFGQRSEFNEAVSLEWWVSDLWGHHGLQQLIKDLNAVYRAHPALWQLDGDPAGFQWINADDAGHNTYAWVRSDAADQRLAVVVNFSSEPWYDYEIGLPQAGRWSEIINTDATLYDGSGIGNFGEVTAIAEPWGDFPARAKVQVPPLGAVILRYDGDEPAPRRATASTGAELTA